MTIACWINVAGVAGRIQRIFDIPLSVNSKGLAVDISGTNMIYSGWNHPTALILTTVTKYSNIYLWLDANSSSNFTLNGSTISQWNGSNGGVGTSSISATLYTNPNYVSNSPTNYNFTSSGYYSTGNSESLFFVVSFPNYTSSAAIYLVAAPSGSNSRYIGINYPSSGNLGILKTDTAAGIMGTGYTITANTKCLISLTTIYNNSSILGSTIIRVNGVTLIISNSSSGNPSFAQTNTAKNTNFGYIYSPYASGTTPIYYYEIIGIYNSGIMTLTDMKIIESYLNTKWNLGYTI